MCQIYVYTTCYRVRLSCAVTTSCTVWWKSAVAYLDISGMWNVPLNIPLFVFLRDVIILFPAAFSQKVTKAWIGSLIRGNNFAHLSKFTKSNPCKKYSQTLKSGSLPHEVWSCGWDWISCTSLYERERINIIWICEQSALINMQFLNMF